MDQHEKVEKTDEPVTAPGFVSLPAGNTTVSTWEPRDEVDAFPLEDQASPAYVKKTHFFWSGPHPEPQFSGAHPQSLQGMYDRGKLDEHPGLDPNWGRGKAMPGFSFSIETTRHFETREQFEAAVRKHWGELGAFSEAACEKFLKVGTVTMVDTEPGVLKKETRFEWDVT